MGDAEVWATICLNTAFAGAFRVLLPACTNLAVGAGLVATRLAPSGVAQGAVAAVTAAALIGGALLTAALPLWTSFQLLCDPEGRLWMDRIANVQVLDVQAAELGARRAH